MTVKVCCLVLSLVVSGKFLLPAASYESGDAAPRAEPAAGVGCHPTSAAVGSVLFNR